MTYKLITQNLRYCVSTLDGRVLKTSRCFDWFTLNNPSLDWVSYKFIKWNKPTQHSILPLSCNCEIITDNATKEEIMEKLQELRFIEELKK